MSTAGCGGIFVSYRHEESSAVAGRLSDRLRDRFGADRVFIDVDAIEPGADFAEAISRAVDACVVLVAVIGPGWLRAADERGGRLLDDPEDWVQLEIRTALTREVRVIPVLVDGAVMPRREDLPESLAGLARRNALPIRHESFRDDAGRLVRAIERVLAPAAVSGGAEGARPAGDASGAMVKEGSGAGQTDLIRIVRLLDEAESIANSLTTEYLRVLVLSDMADAMAVTDPARAARLARDAESIANSLTNKNTKAPALSHLADVALSHEAVAVAVTDPSDAVRIATSITSESLRARAMSAVAGIVAVTSPDRAMRIANSTRQPWVMSAVAVAVAVTDPRRAERITDSITDKPAKARALSHLAAAVTDPAWAARLARDAESIATSITDKPAKARVLSDMAVAVTDLAQAARLARDAARIADSITDKDAKAWALSHAAEAMAITDPSRAEYIADFITNEWAKARALIGIAKALAT